MIRQRGEGTPIWPTGFIRVRRTAGDAVLDGAMVNAAATARAVVPA